MLSIPPMTSSGQRLRIKGQGVRSKDGTQGDLYVEVQIKLPATMDESVKQAVESMRNDYPTPIRAGISW